LPVRWRDATLTRPGGWYPIWLAISSTRSRVAAFTDPGRLNARDTVDFDTAALVATSSIVAIELTPNFGMTESSA
jgi:hypothetical protein